MAKFKRRVGRVSVRERAIVACKFVGLVGGGAKTLAVAKDQMISARRALQVLAYAEKQGWIWSVPVKHRGNSFAFRWIVSERHTARMHADTSLTARSVASSLVNAYFWGKNA